MKIFCFSYTRNGAVIAGKIRQYFSLKSNTSCFAYTKEKYRTDNSLNTLESLSDNFFQDIFQKNNALIFIGAAAIAVRKIAPFLQSKVSDPAVIAVDEQGKFVIPLLSGHIGGANELAIEIANLLKSTPVITTATDLQQKFAVDSWAAKAGLVIVNAEEIKNISAAVLEGEPVGLVSDFPMENDLPPPLSVKVKTNLGIHISAKCARQPFAHTLTLTPKCIVAGMGCRKNISVEAVETLLFNTLKELKLSKHALAVLATIDLKKDEQAFLLLAKKYNLQLLTYSAGELKNTGGEFSSSPFVQQITGVDNVCERAAVRAAGNKRLICLKRSFKGVTIALAQKDYLVRWPSF